MQVKVLVGAQHAYACIKTKGTSLDVLLSPGRSPAKSLQETATEMREKAAKLIARAEMVEQAQKLL